MTLPWYKHNAKDFLDGTATLTLEERGAYITILDLIYLRGRPVPDEPRFLAGNCLVSVRAWSKLRASLIVKGKLFALDFNGQPCLANSRAAAELAPKVGETSAKLQDNSDETSAKVSDKVGETEPEVKENKDIAAAIGRTLATQNTPLDIDRELEEVSPSTKAREPVDWAVRLKEATLASGDGLDRTSTGLMHYADLKALCEPATGEPCDWSEVLDAIRMCSARAKTRGKPLRSWSWVREDALALRDKRLNSANPAPQTPHERPDPIDRKRTNFGDHFAAAERVAQQRALQRAGGA